MIKSLHLLLGRPGDLLSTGILSVDILTNLSASILVTYWSRSLLLLSTHSLIDWITQDALICWLLILTIFVLPTIFLSTFISFAYSMCLFFMFLPLFLVIIRRMVALYIFDSVSFLIYLVLQTGSFKHSCCFLSLGFNLFYQISWTGNVYALLIKFHKFLYHPAVNFQFAE